ncbi:ABC transporter substrate-binding protein [Helicobacter baculiformis]|uniref:ABC transporter substrate-binding protein n=1 Tax=Helicobacter baculiformis TaxID=427351 RepID=A0ABV7ZGM9_9HELI|nr:ABC transporter substrate-binding protein [Helicobacter baculiformis]
MRKWLAGFLGLWLLWGNLGAEGKFGGTLIYARGADGSSMDPALVTDGESYASTSNIYETLVRFRYGTTELEPALASSWEISKDGLVYTFHLRKGVYFHTTKYWNKKVEFTSKDVLFSFKRQMAGGDPYYKGRSYIYWESMAMSHIIKSIEAPDRYTIKITLKKPEAPFLANLGMDFLSILSQDYAQHLASQGKQDELSRKPIGTGPFKFLLWLKDDKVILTRNPDYWGAKAYLDKVVIRVIPNPSSRALALEKGEVSLISAPNRNEVPHLQSLPNVVVEKAPSLMTAWISLNTQKKPFDNRLVRLALNHAVNADDYIKVVYGGYAQKAVNPLPPGMWGYNIHIKPYAYDLAKAKQLLKQAGYPNGFETTLYTAAKHNKKGSEFIQAQLAKIGIKVKIEFFEWGAYLKKTAMGEHMMAFSGWMADTGDPDNFLYILWSKHAASQIPSQNSSFYKSDAYSDLVTRAKEITDQKERTKLYERAQVIFHEDVPWIPLAYPDEILPHLVSVKGLKVTGVQLNRFSSVYFDK